jgi:hypothetical protein
MSMDRRRAALGLLLLFVLCIGVAVVLSGGRPGLQQGIAPTVAAYIGYLLAFGAAVLLIAPGGRDAGDTRTLGIMVLGAVVVLVVLDVLTAHGPNIGAGLVQLVGELVILVVAARLAMGIARARRAG